MTTTDAILRHLENLPESKKAEVLDFIAFLMARTDKTTHVDKDRAWSDFSLAMAMRGMEDEPSPYTSGDLKEPFNRGEVR